MGYQVREFQDTPNPNAIKCVLDREVARESRSYFNADQATGDPLAAALFAVGGVTNVLIHGDWVTVNKEPGRAWATLKPKLRAVLAEAP